MLPSDFLDHGALGVSLLVLLVSIGVLMRILMWAREILNLVLGRIEANTAALVRLSERLRVGKEAEP